MKIKHKVQRKLDPTFQAELNLCIFCGPTTWWQWVVCAGSGDGLWRWLSGAHLLGRCNCGIRGRVGISTSGLQWAVQCCSLRPPWWAGCGWGLWFLWIWDWASFPPSLHGLPQKSSQVPGSPPILSEPCVYSTCVRASFGFVFLSQRSWHWCKHRRVYLQARACVQVYPTEWSRDLEMGFSLVLRAGLGDLQKGWSNSSSSVYILIWGLQRHWDLF